MEIEIARLFFEAETPLTEKQSHLFRGCVSGLFPELDMVHNHEKSGKSMQRYPKIQFKVVFDKAVIVALGKPGIKILHKIFAQMEELELGPAKHNLQKYPIIRRVMEVNKEMVGISPYMLEYEFVTPCIAVTGEKYREYRKASINRKNELVSKSLTGSILRLAKGIDHYVNQKIQLEHDLKTDEVLLKGEKMIGFRGSFITNFYIPDFIGLGKSPARGYGCCFRKVQ